MKNSPTLNRFCHCSSIGIDVSKASLEVVGLEGDAVWRTEIDNSRVSIEMLAKALSRCPSDGGVGGRRGCSSCGAHGGLQLVALRRPPLRGAVHERAAAQARV